MPGDESFSTDVLDARPVRRDQAMRLLLTQSGDHPRDAARRVRRLIQYATHQRLSLGPVVGAYRGGDLVSAAMVIVSPGRLGTVFLPLHEAVGAEDDATRAALARARDEAWRRNLSMLQLLRETPAEGKDLNLLQEAGFEFLAELIYLVREAEDPCPTYTGGAEVSFQNLTQRSESEFAAVTEQTYVQSMDCPKLVGVRTIDDVIATHKATGNHDPRIWFLAYVHQAPAGALLMAELPDRDALEVVYMGVVPSMRGRGIGDAILQQAVDVCRERDGMQLTLAVDRDNVSARRLYNRWCFRPAGRRYAWFMPHPSAG